MRHIFFDGHTRPQKLEAHATEVSEPTMTEKRAKLTNTIRQYQDFLIPSIKQNSLHPG